MAYVASCSSRHLQRDSRVWRSQCGCRRLPWRL
jgi:hypothetical protein